MGKMSWLLRAAKNPVETVVFIFSVGLFLYAAYVISPWYTATYSPIAGAFPTRPWEYLLGGIFLGASTPGIMAPFKKEQHGWLKLSTFLLFMSYLFLFILRILIVGWLPVSWLPILMISVVNGMLRLYLEVNKE